MQSNTRNTHEWNDGRVDTSNWGISLPAVYNYIKKMLFLFSTKRDKQINCKTKEIYNQIFLQLI
jgi:hypothetical protein